MDPFQLGLQRCNLWAKGTEGPLRSIYMPPELLFGVEAIQLVQRIDSLCFHGPALT